MCEFYMQETVEFGGCAQLTCKFSEQISLASKSLFKKKNLARGNSFPAYCSNALQSGSLRGSNHNSQHFDYKRFFLL
jgi:hypothetical protein